MSASIDNKIVSMEFDNSKFEGNVAVTLNTLDKLQDSLRFEGATKGLEQIDKASKSVNFGVLSTAVENVGEKFSALEIAAITAISNITTKVMNLGAQIVKSLTIDQVSGGFSKYEEQLKNVRTISNATERSVEEVEAQLEKLLWYTDETSYSYTAMVNNVAKFTSQNIHLEDAVKQMQGIANMAGLAGASVTDATHAMDGFSKAMAQGYMSRQNWRWVQTAHLETVATKKQFIEAAKACGVLTGEIEDVGVTTEGTTVTVENFIETLKDKWLTKEVMAKAFENVSRYSEAVYTLQQGYNELNKEIGGSLGIQNAMDRLEDKTNLSEETIRAYAKGVELATGKSIDFNTAQKMLIENLDEVSKSAFQAGQEYRTFTDAIDYIKDAATSAWMQVYNNLFGNIERASRLWGEMGEQMYTTFVEPIYAIVDASEEFANLNGLQVFIDTFKSFVSLIESAVLPVKKTFETLFPKNKDLGAGKAFYNWLYKLKLLLGDLTFTEKELIGLEKIFTKLLTPLKWVVNLAKKAQKLVLGIILAVRFLVGLLLEAIADFNGFGNIIEKVFGSERAEKIKNAWTKIGTSIGNVIQKIKTGIAEGILKTIDKISQSKVLNGIAQGFVFIKECVLDLIANGFDYLANHPISETLKKIGEIVSNIGKTIKDKVVSVFPTLGAWFDSIEQKLSPISNMAKNFLSMIKSLLASFNIKIDTTNFFSTITTSIGAAVKVIADAFIYLKDQLSKLGGTSFGKFFTKLWSTIKTNLGGFGKKMSEAWSTVKGAFVSFFDVIKVFFNKSKEIDFVGFGGVFKNMGASFKEVINSFKMTGDNVEKAVSGPMDKIKAFVVKVYTWIKDVTKNVDASQVLILALIISMVTLVNKVKSLVGTFKRLLSSYVQKEKTNNITHILLAVSLAVATLAGSIYLLGTKVESTKIKDIASSLSILFGVMAGAIVAIGVIFKLAKIEADLKGYGIAIAGFGLAISSLAQAFVTFSDMKWSQIGKSAAAMAIVTSFLIGTFALLSKLSGGSLGGSLKLLLVSMAIKSTFETLSSDKAIENYNKIVDKFLEVVLKLKNFFFNNDETVMERIAKSVAAFGGVFVLIKIFGSMKAMGSMANIGKLLSGVALFVGAMTLAIKALGSMDKSTLKKGMGTLAVLGLFTAALIATLSLFSGFIGGSSKSSKFGTDSSGIFQFNSSGSDISKIGSSLIAVAAALGVMAIVVKATSSMSDGEIKQGIKVVGVISLMASGLIASTGLARQVNSGTIIALAFMLLEIFAAFNKFTDPSNAIQWKDVWQQFTAFGVLMGMIDVFLYSASKIKSESSKPLLAVVAMIGLLFGSLYLITKTDDPDAITKACYGLTGAMVGASAFLLAYGVMEKLMDGTTNASSKKTATNLLGIIATVGTMVGSIILLARSNSLSSIKDTWYQLGFVMTSMAGFMISAAEAMKIMNGATSGSGKFADFGIIASLMVTMVGSTIALSLLTNDGKLANSWYQMSTVMIAMGAFMAEAAIAMNFMHGASYGANEWADLGALAGLVSTMVLAMIGIVDFADLGKLKDTWYQLSGVMIAMGVFITEMSVALNLIPKRLDFKNMGPSLIGIVVMMATFIGSMAALTGDMVDLTKLKDSWAELSVVMLAFGAFIVILMGALRLIAPALNTIGNSIGGLMTAFLWVGLIVSAIIGMAGVFGFLASKEYVTYDQFEEGMNILQMIFLKIGETVDMFTKNAIVNAADTIATSLERFATGLVTAFKEFKDISKEDAEGALEVVKVAASIMSVEFVGGLTFLTSGTKVAGDLTIMGAAIQKFAKRFEGINIDEVNAASNIVNAFAALYSELPGYFGVGQVINGTKSLAVFASDLPSVATGISDFSANVADIDTEATVAAVNMLKDIAIASKDIPSTGGLKGLIFGEHDLGGFGDGLSKFADGLKKFQDNLGGYYVYDKSQKDAIEFLKDLAHAADEIPNAGGKIADWIGDNELGDFADQFWKLGDGIGKFKNRLAIYQWTKYDDTQKQAIAMATDLAKMSQDIVASGGFKQLIGGNQQLDTFGAQLVGLALGIAGFSNALKGDENTPGFVYDENVQHAVDVAKALASISSLLNSEHFWAIFTHTTELDSFSDVIGDKLGQGLLSFHTNVSQITDFEKDMQAVSVVQAIASVARILNTGVDFLVFSSFADEVSAFGESYREFGNAVETYSPETVERGLDTMRSMHEVVQLIQNDTYDPDKFSAFNECIAAIFSGISSQTATGEIKSQPIVDALIKLLNSAAEGVSSQYDYKKYWNIGAMIRISLIEGLRTGSSGTNSEAYRAGAQLGHTIETGIRDSTRVYSPSDLYIEIGEYITKSVAMGIMDNDAAMKVANAIKSLGGELEGSWGEVLGDNMSKVSGDLSEEEANAIINGIATGMAQADKNMGTELYPEATKLKNGVYVLIEPAVEQGATEAVSDAMDSAKLTFMDRLKNIWNGVASVADMNKIKAAVKTGEVGKLGKELIGVVTDGLGLDQYTKMYGEGSLMESMEAMVDNYDKIQKKMEEEMSNTPPGAGGAVEKTLAQIRSEYAITDNYISAFYDRHKEQLDYIAGKQGNTGYALASDRVYAYAQRLYEAQEGTTKLTDIAANDMEKLEEYWKGVGEIMDEVAKKYREYAQVDIWGSNEDAEELGPGNTADYLTMNNKDKMETYKKWEKDVRDVFEKLKKSGATEYAQEIFDKVVAGGVDDQTWLTIFKNSTVEGIKAFSDSANNLQLEAASFGSEMSAMAMDLGYELNEGVMDGVLTSLYKAQDAGIESMEAAKAAMAEYREKHPFDEEGLATIQGLIDGMQENLTQVNVKIHEIYNSADKTAGGLFDTSMLYVDGQNVVQGLINGINSKVGDLKTAMEKLASVAETTITGPGGFNEHSPSKDFFKFGVYVVQGLINGIKNQSTVLETTMHDLASATEDPVYKTFSDIISGMSEEHANPVITPMLDLSLVRQGLSEIDGMMAERRAAKLAAEAGVGGGLGKVVNQTFNQYNNSPKSLDRLTIYRQTKNQMSVMKEAISQA